ncbi:Protein of unknown function (DUF1200) [Synechococcus sp. PCC 7502]|uniref:PH domain-containing protein n=1 Tax=Synechococcus sp. PCC 7502 TaxID=1173263 RepID=UPI00029F830B|nr:PH domain-containing protein [Synechococcus sp. PCC 7502]AFY74378.1 Protein of unknown function (DUF1200) [Synechococcus sp. PCC 7502]
MSVYPSKVDGWLAAILIISPLLIMATGVFTLSVNKSAALLAIASGIFSALLTAVLVIPCRYTITDSELLIRSGILNYRLRLEDIKSVERSSNPLSAPALSLTRVKINLKQGGGRLISPLDRDRFIQEINSRIKNN